jgi:hypothetical protein
MELAIRMLQVAKRAVFSGPALYARIRKLQPAGVLAVADPGVTRPSSKLDVHF